MRQGSKKGQSPAGILSNFSQFSRKRGISAIVATVMIILVTVVAISVIWLTVIPMIGEGSNFDDPNARLEIDTEGGYTFWDENSGILYVQVARGADSANIIGMDIIVTTAGDSKKFSFGKEFVPGPNEKKLVEIPNIISKPDSVRVVPIFGDGTGGNHSGSVTSEVMINRGRSSGGSGKACTVTSGCDAGYKCENSKCVSVDVGTATCMQDIQCGNGQICVGGVCVLMGASRCDGKNEGDACSGSDGTAGTCATVGGNMYCFGTVISATLYPNSGSPVIAGRYNISSFSFSRESCVAPPERFGYKYIVSGVEVMSPQFNNGGIYSFSSNGELQYPCTNPLSINLRYRKVLE